MKDKIHFNEICNPAYHQKSGDAVVVHGFTITKIKTLSYGASTIARLIQKSNEIRLMLQDVEDGEIEERPLDGFAETGLHCALEMLLHDLVFAAENLDLDSHDAARKKVAE